MMVVVTGCELQKIHSFKSIKNLMMKYGKKGKAVQIMVEGEENPDIMTIIEPPTAIR